MGKARGIQMDPLVSGTWMGNAPKDWTGNELNFQNAASVISFLQTDTQIGMNATIN